MGSDNSDENLAAIAKRLEGKYVSIIALAIIIASCKFTHTGTKKEEESPA